MRKSLALLILTVLCPVYTLAQGFTLGQNYTLEVSPLVEGITSVSQLDTLSPGRAIRDITYYDGFGYPVQEIAVDASGSGRDIVRHREWDTYWRESRSYLPYEAAAGASGSYRQGAPGETMDYYGGSVPGIPSTSHPFSQTVYEQSQLDRVLQQGAPGEAWQPSSQRGASTGRTVMMDYGTCSLSGEDAVRMWRLQDDSIAFSGSNYLPGTLRRETVRDGDWTGGRLHSTDTYTDREGRTVLVRRWVEGPGSSEIPADTYYVYDLLGRLRCVLQPELISGLAGQAPVSLQPSGQQMRRYAFLYRYDGHGDCTWKRLPGCSPQRYWYDTAHRMVLSQDGSQNACGRYTFHLYDWNGRMVVTGTCSNAQISRLTSERRTAAFTGGGTLAGYAFPVSIGDSITLETVSYYDSYDFLDGVADSGLSYGESSDYGTPSLYSDGDIRGTGQLTGSRIYDTDGGSTLTACYYDKKGRIIQRRGTNHLGGNDSFFMSYSFTGKETERLHLHSTPAGSITELYEFSYDGRERPVSVSYSLNGGTPVLLSGMEYDGLGRLRRDRRNPLIAGLSTEYAYNIRGWITQMDSPLFTETLHYDQPGAAGTPAFNGNVSAMDWQVHADGDTTLRGYSFSYDALDRLTSADYLQGGQPSGRYGTSYTYSLNCKMTSLRRNGQTGPSSYGLVDDLTYTYVGNLLRRVEDAAVETAFAGGTDFRDGAHIPAEYTYDANGNMTSDANRGITGITYNRLNLPEQITFSTGDVIRYVYGYDGTKLRVDHVSHDGSTRRTDYSGSIVYEDGTASRVLTEGAYATLPDGNMHYYVKDHLGSNRLVVGSSGQVEERNDYYPYGGLFSNSSTLQPYRYNGKELDGAFGLDMYDYGARLYDPALGWWSTADPESESGYGISPYTFCQDSPINLIDPDGRFPWLKVAKVFGKGAKTIGKEGIQSFGKAFNAALLFSDIIDDYNVITDERATGADRVIAGISLASNILSPVSFGDIKEISNVSKKIVHGNSKLSTKAQHAYDIIDKRTVRPIKTGISSGPIRKDGKSYRAELQVRKWNEKEGGDFYESVITYKIDAGEGARDRILKYEKLRADELRPFLDPSKHKKP